MPRSCRVSGEGRMTISEPVGDGLVSRQRVFLALWPDERTRDQLVRLSRRLHGPGRLVPPEHLHLTLAFVGVAESDQVACLVDRLDALQTELPPLLLDQLGYFDRARVAWVGPSQSPDALMLLSRRAHELCRTCGMEIRTQPFHPHVTLRRFAQPLPRPLVFKPIRWRVGRVVLIESGRNGVPGAYRILAEVDTD